MPKNRGSVSVMPRDGWSIDDRGYIHGGFGTPVFLKAKRHHNSALTKNKREIQALEALREKLRNRPIELESQRLLREKLMGQPNHLTKKDSNA